MRPHLSEVEALKRLFQGPFLLLGEGASPSPLYQVVETPLGPAVFPTERGVFHLGLRRRPVGEGAYLRELFLRAMEEYASSRGLPFRADGSAVLIGPPEKEALVVLALSSRRPSFPWTAAIRVVISPRKRKGLWVRLGPGCLEDVFQILDAHFSRQAEDELAPPP